MKQEEVLLMEKIIPKIFYGSSTSGNCSRWKAFIDLSGFTMNGP